MGLWDSWTRLWYTDLEYQFSVLRIFSGPEHHISIFRTLRPLFLNNWTIQRVSRACVNPASIKDSLLLPRDKYLSPRGHPLVWRTHEPGYKFSYSSSFPVYLSSRHGFDPFKPKLQMSLKATCWITHYDDNTSSDWIYRLLVISDYPIFGGWHHFTESA